MQPGIPYNFINLVGDGVMRGVTLELPEETVRTLLPPGLVLGAQSLTRPGTHPVVMFFFDMLNAHMSVPSLVPTMTYHEHSLGVPFTYVTGGGFNFTHSGPFYFMRRLFLDNIFATMGGMMFWGFPKRMANIAVFNGRYDIRELGSGEPLISLEFEPEGDFRPLGDFPNFEPHRQLMDQPIVSQLPLGEGPFFVCSDFDKKWDTAELRPLRTTVDIKPSYVRGVPRGLYTAQGIDVALLGSYELKARWRESLIYPCDLHATG